MFTGIITDIAEILEVSGTEELTLDIITKFDLDSIIYGASIAHNGVCLTIMGKGKNSYQVFVSAETIKSTTIGCWKKGMRINLERAMRVGDELGGHFVSGHVDGIAEVSAVDRVNESLHLLVKTPKTLGRFVAAKGSVALDGVSLTVNEVIDDNDGECFFGVNLIPQTQKETTLGGLMIGDKLNMEIDMLARYVSRLAEKD